MLAEALQYLSVSVIKGCLWNKAVVELGFVLLPGFGYCYLIIALLRLHDSAVSRLHHR